MDSNIYSTFNINTAEKVVAYLQENKIEAEIKSDKLHGMSQFENFNYLKVCVDKNNYETANLKIKQFNEENPDLDQNKAPEKIGIIVTRFIKNFVILLISLGFMVLVILLLTVSMWINGI